MARTLRLLLVLFLAQLAAACYPVHFETQELRLQLDRERDLASFELTLRDLSLDTLVGEDASPERVQEALDFLGRALAGERVFIVPLELDVWDVDEELRRADRRARLGRSSRPASDALLRDLRVVEVRLERDDEGQLNLVQRVELGGLSAHLAALNAEGRQVLLDEGATEAGKQRIAQDPRGTEALALAAAQVGHDWIRWGDDGLALHLPMASEDLVEQLRALVADGLLSEAPRPDDALAAYMEARFGLSYVDYGLQLVRDLRIEPDQLVLYLGTPEGELATTWEFGQLVRQARLLDDEGEVGERDRAGLLEALKENRLAPPQRYAAED